MAAAHPVQKLLIDIVLDVAAACISFSDTVAFHLQEKPGKGLSQILLFKEILVFLQFVPDILVPGLFISLFQVPGGILQFVRQTVQPHEAGGGYHEQDTDDPQKDAVDEQVVRGLNPARKHAVDIQYESHHGCIDYNKP